MIVLIGICSSGRIERFELTEWANNLQCSSELHQRPSLIDGHSDLGPHQEVKWWDGVNGYGLDFDPFLIRAPFDDCSEAVRCLISSALYRPTVHSVDYLWHP